MRANTGEMEDCLRPVNRACNRFEVLDVTDQLAVGGLGSAHAVECGDVMLVGPELADDPLAKLSSTPGNQDPHGMSAGVIREPRAHVNSWMA